MATAVSSGIHLCLEGLIGCGKTRFINLLANALNERKANFMIFPEPIEEWTAFSDKRYNVLDMNYKDPRNYAYIFQNMALSTKVKQLRPYLDHNILVERCIGAQSQVFIPVLKEKGLITDLQHQTLTALIGLLDISPDFIIYLRCQPETAMVRIANRNRPEEKNIKIEYLKMLEEKYDDWLIREYGHGNVIVIDADSDMYYSQAMMNLVIREIETWALKTCRIAQLY